MPRTNSEISIATLTSIVIGLITAQPQLWTAETLAAAIGEDSRRIYRVLNAIKASENVQRAQGGWRLISEANGRKRGTLTLELLVPRIEPPVIEDNDVGDYFLESINYGAGGDR